MSIARVNDRPHTNAAEAARAARENSIIGLIASTEMNQATFDNDPFGTNYDADPTSGTGDVTHRGGLHAGLPGEEWGLGGLGTLGPGQGGGGDGGGYGPGKIGPMGTGPNGGGGLPGTFSHRPTPRPPRGPVVHVSNPTVVGMNPEAIRRVVLRNLNQVRRCHEQGLQQDPQMGGRLAVRFTIGMGGLVTTSDVTDKDPNISGQVASCVANVVRRLQFAEPPEGSPARITYPFTLDPPTAGVQ
jgi:hypothetical protein